MAVLPADTPSQEVVSLVRDLLGGQRTSPSTIDSSTNLREEEKT